ncbi:MAG: peroxiredoxin [Candidatus Melainabacteria bacterium]|nr:peroxiredoxin [Candidatus Melainabacteria bacterium]
MAPQIGREAPEFTAQAYVEGEIKQVSLSQYRGKWVVLFFYPLDFTFVCPTEIKGFNEKKAEFDKLNTQILGASVDSVYSHKEWSESSLGRVNFPLLSDINHRISRDYGVLIEDKGISLRGAFVIDPNGVLRSYLVNDLAVGRSVDEVLRLVQAFQSGDLCPVGWKPGEQTLGKA